MASNFAVGSLSCDMSSYKNRTPWLQMVQNDREMEQHFNILAKMKQFRNEEKFCDAEIIVNGITFSVHKTVLAAWSSVLASELLPSSLQNVKTNIHVTYVNVEAFSDFLEFLYSGFVMLNYTNVEPLLHIGKTFNVGALVQQCENFLCSHIYLDNFVKNYFISLKYGLSHLEEDVSNFVQCNISQAIEQATFLKLTPQKFSTFMKTGKMTFAKQEIQFSLIAAWVGNELSVREQYLFSLLSLVKWVHPVTDLLIQVQHTDNIFMVNEFCLFQLLHNLYGVFGDTLGVLTATYSRLLNLFRFKVPDLLKLTVIGDEVDKEILDIIPISVTCNVESDNAFNTGTTNLYVLDNKNSNDHADDINNKNINNSGCGLEQENIARIVTVEVGVNTEVNTAHLQDSESQTFLETPDSISAMLMNFKKGGSPNLDMICQDSTELRTKDSSKENKKSKKHRRKSESCKVVHKRKMKVEIVSNSELKLKMVPVKEKEKKKKRGRPQKSESGKTIKHDKNKDKVKVEVLTVKQEPVDTDDDNRDNTENEEKLLLKEQLEVLGIFGDFRESYVVPDNGDDDDEERDESYEPPKGKRGKEKKSGKLKVSLKVTKSKKPYKPPILPFKCTEKGCTYTTKTDARLEKHIASIHNTHIKLYCKKCDYVAPLMKELCLHMKTHISGPPYRCDTEGCTFKAWWMRKLVIHQMDHLGERPYSCDLCSKAFRTANQLSCHKNLHEGRRFVCDVCNKRFSTKGIMKQHRTIHFDKKEYLCDLCGFSTKHPGILVSHKKMHTGDLLTCSFDDCSYTTPKQGHMNQHLNRHLNIRNHICQVCGKSFVVRCKLLRHEKIHLDHKLFKCKQCEYTTIRTDRMKLHLATHGIVFRKRKLNQFLPDPVKQDEIDYHQFYEKIESAARETSEHRTTPTKQKIETPDQSIDIVNAAMNAAVEGRLMETHYTMSIPQIQMDPATVAAVASLHD